MALPAELTADEMIAALPEGTVVTRTASPEGRRMRRTLKRGRIHLIAQEVIGALRQGQRGRRATDVLSIYSGSYTRPWTDSAAETRRRPILIRFGADYIAKVRDQYPLLLCTRRLGDIAAALSPGSVAEVGSGNGRNLLYLAARFPDISFTGYELTETGTKSARAAQTLDLHETDFGRMYGITAENVAATRAIRFEQASAFVLPAPDKSFDLVFTFSALEQMQDGLPKALSELRRVARRHVLLFEPFRDCNDSLGRLYLWARNYFRLSTTTLPRYGLRPIATWYSVPVKPTFACGLVLCEPI